MALTYQQGGGFIYLIENTDTLEYKIGLTKNSPEKRLKQLQTGSPAKLRLKASYRTNYPHRLESILHRYYSPYRLEGEWFALSDGQVNDFLTECKRTDDIIELMKDNPFFSKGLK